MTDTAWQQTSLLNPEAVELTVRVGWMPESREALVTVDVVDKLTQSLIFASTRTVHAAHSPERVGSVARREVIAALGQCVSPF